MNAILLLLVLIQGEIHVFKVGEHESHKACITAMAKVAPTIQVPVGTEKATLVCARHNTV